MVGQKCWHVSAGGATVPSFLVVMGDRIPRKTPLANAAQPDEFRQARGSIELLVWSAWRVQTDTEVLASSDQGEVGLDAVRSLVGIEITAVECDPPAWDLRLRFSNGHTIATFSDHVEPDASIAQNWDFWAEGRRIHAGPGSVWDEGAEE